MKAMKLEEFEKLIERRKAELGLEGDDYVLPNSGVSRTAEKRELLTILKECGVDRPAPVAGSGKVDSGPG
ncbi:MAG: hypothetical protein NTV97_09975 [Alphaproteobacteria bacterium]|nr:hypothetical protein [Alphaproteobacteria bacterium]